MDAEDANSSLLESLEYLQNFVNTNYGYTSGYNMNQLKTDEEKEIKYSVIQGRDSLRSLIKVKEELNDNMRS